MRAPAAVLIAFAIAAPGPAAARQSSADDQLLSPKLRIEWAAFKTLYDAGAVVVVDVRDPASFEAGHIPGARSVPLDRIARFAPALKKLGKPIVLYCA